MKVSLHLLVSAVVACSVVFVNASAEEPATRDKLDIGLQLYSLRAAMEKGVPGTLAIVRKMGITDVEVANLYGHSAASFRALLDKEGLKASGVHFQWDRFSRDIDGIIKDAKALGCQSVTLPWIPHNGDFTINDARAAVEKFNEWGRKLSEAGLTFAYHPHGY